MSSGLEWRAAGRDEDVLGGHRPVVADQANLVSADKFRPLVKHLRPGRADVLGVEAFEARDLFFLGVAQRGPVEAAVADCPAKSGGVFEGFREARGVDHQLLRHQGDRGAAAHRLRHVVRQWQ